MNRIVVYLIAAAVVALAVGSTAELISTKTELSIVAKENSARKAALDTATARIEQLASELNVERAATTAKAKTISDMSAALADANARADAKAKEGTAKIITKYVDRVSVLPAAQTACGLSSAASEAVNDFINQ